MVVFQGDPLGQADVADGLRESRIFSQGRESRVDVQREELETAVFDCPRQVLQAGLDIVEGEVHGGELDRRDVSLSGLLLQLADDPLRLLLPAGPGQCSG